MKILFNYLIVSSLFNYLVKGTNLLYASVQMYYSLKSFKADTDKQGCIDQINCSSFRPSALWNNLSWPLFVIWSKFCSNLQLVLRIKRHLPSTLNSSLSKIVNYCGVSMTFVKLQKVPPQCPCSTPTELHQFTFKPELPESFTGPLCNKCHFSVSLF